jgi:fructokinase
VIVSCGEALVDLVPEPRPGGGPMNVAVAAARLGAPAAFLGRVSTDAHGELLWRHMAASGVRLEAAERGPEPTARAILDRGPPQRFRFEGAGTADAALERADLGPLGPGPHLVHGGGLGLVRGATAERLTALAESHGGLVSLDPNPRPAVIGDGGAWRARLARWLAVADLVQLSADDVAWIWPGEPVEAVAERLLTGGAAAVVVTAGASGAALHLPGAELAVTAPPVEAVDTVGAGDVHCGAMLAELWRRGATDRAGLEAVGAERWVEILALAARAAAASCTRPGADPPWRVQLNARPVSGDRAGPMGGSEPEG